MIAAAVNLIVVLASIAVFGAAFTGIGLAVRRAFGLRSLSLDDTFVSFWAGYGVTLLFLILWNFALPVGLAALVLVLSAGGLGLATARRGLAQAFGREPWRPRWWELVVLALGALWVARECTPGFNSWDGALYHVQAVNWAKAFAVVPGLANLHGPLAFNNSSFLYDAMVDSGWWEERGFHVANGTLLLVAVLQALFGGLRWLRGDRSATSVRCFAFVLLALAFHTARDAATYSTDLPAALVLAAAAALLYGLLDRRDVRPAGADAYDLFAIALLLAAAASIKLTVAVFAAVALPVAVGVRFRRWPWREAGLARSLTWMSLTLVLFAGAWTTRGVVMSGYPFFPIAVGGFPVDWRAPVEHAALETAYIALTERGFTWGLVGSNWVRLMFLGDVTAAVLPGAIAIAAAFALWRWKRHSRAAHGALPGTWWMLLPVLAAIGVWFVTAASHRYSPPLFWILAALCVSECDRAFRPRLAGRGRRLVAALVVIIAIGPIFAERGFVMVRAGADAGLGMRSGRVDILDRSLATVGGNVEVATFTTRSGFEISIPSRGERSAAPNSCWNAPIPCTPNPAPNLRLRVPGRLDRGFKVEGDWEMMDWPYYWHAWVLPELRARR
jgi:hypothetical protein